MLRKYFITLSLTLGFGYTLSLQESINLTLNANHTIKEQEFLL